MSKIMLVEDDNNLREIYEARLQAEGYQIVAAKDGEEALVLAKSEKPDLVISDIMMPKISGFEMLDIMRNTDGLKDVKVIMLTALGQNDDQQKADKLGADRYLVKSQVTLEDIVKVTHELLGDAAGATPATAVPADAPAAPAETASPAPANPPTEQAAAPIPVVATPEPVADPAPPVEPVVPEPGPDIPSPAADTAAPAAVSDAADEAKDDAQSTNQEEADLESQVESFVTGATDVPTPPSPDTPTEDLTAENSAAIDKLTASEPETAEPVEEPTTAPPVEDVPAGEANANMPGSEIKPDPVKAAADDKLVTDAAATLASNAPEPASDSAAKPADTGDGRTHKIIAPLDDKPKKDINDLLAVEESKTAVVAVPTPIVVADDPKAKPAAAPPNPVVAPPADAASEPAIVPDIQAALPHAEPPQDPNSIAL